MRYLKKHIYIFNHGQIIDSITKNSFLRLKPLFLNLEISSRIIIDHLVTNYLDSLWSSGSRSILTTSSSTTLFSMAAMSICLSDSTCVEWPKWLIGELTRLHVVGVRNGETELWGSGVTILIDLKMFKSSLKLQEQSASGL